MKRNLKISTLALGLLAVSTGVFAGNKDRVGQSGASELLINPWARTTGVFGLNGSYIGGLEAMKCNIGGLAQDTSMEVGASTGVYLTNTGINVNNVGIAIPLKNDQAIGFNIMSIGFGDITATDYNNPDGYGQFRPSFLNIQMGYSKQFSTHVNAGAAATFVSEQVNNVGAMGVAFEGGIQYVTGKDNNYHLGITLKNLGTNMKFTGTGFAVSGEQTQSTLTYSATQMTPTEKFELPTLLNISGAYDIYMKENGKESKNQKLTLMGNFTSNSFINDYIGVGAEYTYKNMMSLRAAYRWENGIGDPATTSTMFTGIAAGATLQTRLGKGGPMLAIDYSFRPTQRPANGVHMFSLRFTRNANHKDE